MNPLAKLAVSTASKATNAVRNAKNKASEEENVKQSAGAGIASVALMNPLALKVALILGLVGIIAVIIFGLFLSVVNVLNSINTDTCTRTSDQVGFVNEIEDSGVEISEEEREGLLQRPSNPCGGVGFTGQTYPPTIGTKTSDYGPREAPCATCSSFHRGMDIAEQCGAPIYAFAGGTVTVSLPGSETQSNASNPQYPMGIVIIQHTEEFATAYYHTRGSTTTVRAGDVVSAGDIIADQWSNGDSTACHLHFEVRLNGERIDPQELLLSYGYDYTVGYTLESLPPIPDPSEAGNTINTRQYPAGSAQGIAEDLVSTKGWTEEEFASCLIPLWRQASGWSINYSNENSGAYGIPAARPKEALESAGADWATNPRTQVVWGLDYIESKYGDPCVAWAHMQQKNWY